MGCFTCGKGFKPDEVDLVAHFKAEYEKLGVERYVYRLHPGGELMIVKKKYFNEVYESQIKPNLKKGAEYFHVQEYTGNSNTIVLGGSKDG